METWTFNYWGFGNVTKQNLWMLCQFLCSIYPLYHSNFRSEMWNRNGYDYLRVKQTVSTSSTSQQNSGMVWVRQPQLGSATFPLFYRNCSTAKSLIGLDLDQDWRSVRFNRRTNCTQTSRVFMSGYRVGFRNSKTGFLQPFL